MSTPAAELHPCECGCDEMVRNRFARGHHLRKRKLVPLPGPDVPDDELNMGLLEPEDFPGPEPSSPRQGGVQFPNRAGESPDDDEPLEQDRPPGHLSEPARSRREGGSRPRTSPVRVTATIRRDITAKIKMPLFVGGKIWEARDPWCGGVFVHQTDDIAAALTDIVCDSADLVAWFTGPAGGFMKYLNLATALAPVAQVVYGHHVTHRIGGEGEQAGQPDMARYAA